MKRVWSGIVWGLLSVMSSVSGVRADGFLDTVKSVASKPEVQSAAKQVGNKAVDLTKQTAGKSLTGKLEQEINSRLLAEACTRPGGSAGAAAVVHALEWLAMSSSDPENRVVTVVADVDAAFEGSAAAAWEFLGELHARLSDHPRIVTVTPSQCLAAGIEIKALRTLVAGSEVSGSLSSWIGDVARNRAWDLLCDAKVLFDQCVVEGSLTDEEQRLAERQLAVCESADWLLAIGDGDPGRARLALAAFERHLVNLYQILGEAAPEALGGVASPGMV